MSSTVEPASRASNTGGFAGLASVACLLVLLIGGCATYDDRVAPVPLPEAGANHIDVDGVKLLAEAYADPKNAKAAFGFDIRGSGLLPVRFVIDNQGSEKVRVTPGQTFLIDQQGQAWPLLTSEQAYERVKSHVDLGETAKGTVKPGLLGAAAGAIAGAAIGVISGENVGEAAAKGAAGGVAIGTIIGGTNANREIGQKIRNDLGRESLRNRRVNAGELAYGYLFFPGSGEAESATRLRLGIKIGESTQVVNLNL